VSTIARIAIGVLLAGAPAIGGCPWVERAQAQAAIERLVAAGFTARPATSPEQQAELAALPAWQVAERRDASGRAFYAFADPEGCRCTYVGDTEQYARYRERTRDEIDERKRDLEAMAFDPEKYSGFAA
jgi:hypothetical protein